MPTRTRKKTTQGRADREWNRDRTLKRKAAPGSYKTWSKAERDADTRFDRAMNPKRGTTKYNRVDREFNRDRTLNPKGRRNK